MYAQNVEASLRNENTRLDQQMKDLRLDLDDATKSRRDAQQQVKDLESRLGYAPVFIYSKCDIPSETSHS